MHAGRLLCFAALLSSISCSSLSTPDEVQSFENVSTTPTSAPVAGDTVYVVNGGEASLSVIDVATDTVTGTIRLNGVRYPHHIYLSGDRSKIALAIPGIDLSSGHGDGHSHDHSTRGHVLLLDAATGSLLTKTMTDASNHNAVFSPDDASVWTTQSTSPGSTLVLAVSDLSLVEAISVGSGPSEVTFGSSGRYAFVANSSEASVTVIDVAARKPVKKLAVGNTPVGAWQGTDGFAYVDNESDQTVSVINTESLEVVRVFPIGFTPGMLAVGPDNRVWIADSDAGRITVWTREGKLEGSVATGAGAHGVSFEGTGKKVYVSNQSEASVSVVDVATMTVTKKLTVGDKPNGMVFRKAP